MGQEKSPVLTLSAPIETPVEGCPPASLEMHGLRNIV